MRDLFDRLTEDKRKLVVAGTILVAGALIAAGLMISKDDEAEPTTTAPLADAPVAPEAGQQEPAPEEDPKDGKDEGGKGNSGGSDDDEENETSSGPSPSAEPEAPPPGTETGDPVGEVPPDATLSENEAAVQRVVYEYLTSIGKGIGYQACAQLSPSGVETMVRKVAEAAPETKGAGCSQAIVLYQGAYGSAIRDPEISDIEVSGTRATATGPARQRARLTRYDNVWLIDEYGD